MTLVSVDSDGVPGAADSARTFVFGQGFLLHASPVRDDGGVFFLTAARLHVWDDNDVVDLHHRVPGGAPVPVDLPTMFASADCVLADVDANGTRVYLLRNHSEPMVGADLRTGAPGAIESLGYRSGVSAAALSGNGQVAARIVRHPESGITHVWLHDFAAEPPVETNVTPGANASSRTPRLSADGRFVVFASSAWNLVNADTNSVDDVFLHDRPDGTTTLLSRTPTHQAFSPSTEPDISGDGAVACFVSADPLFVGGGGGKRHVIVRVADEFAVISRNASGQLADADAGEPRVNHDGRFVVFTSAATNLAPSVANGRRQVYLHDRASGRIAVLSVTPEGVPADADCLAPAMSPSGRHVTFVSKATNLAADVDGSFYQVYRVDRGPAYSNHPPLATNINLSGPGGHPVAIMLHVSDADGDPLLFSAVPLPTRGTLQDRDGNPIMADTWYDAMSLPWQYTPDDADFFVDEFAVVASDGMAESDPASVRVRMINPAHGYITRVSVRSDGSEGVESPLEPPAVSISGNGELVAFSTRALLAPEDSGNYLDVYLHDATISRSTLVTGHVDRNSYEPAISGDGRFLAYSTQQDSALIVEQLATGNRVTIDTFTGAVPLVPAISHDGQRLVYVKDGRIHLHDRSSGTTSEVSRNAEGLPADGQCRNPSISGDGTVVAFSSNAGNLAAESSAGVWSVYAVYLDTGEIVLLSTEADGESLLADADRPVLSFSGRYAAFSAAPDSTLYHLDVGTGARHAIAVNVANPAMSASGRFLYATRVEAGIAQAYRFDVAQPNVPVPFLISNNAGTPANSNSFAGALSRTGQFAAFASDASDLVPGDTNNARDIFLADLGTVPVPLALPMLSHVDAREGELLDGVALSYSVDVPVDIQVEILEPPTHAEAFTVTPVGPGRAFPTFSYRPIDNTFIHQGHDSLVYRVGDGTFWSAPQTVDIVIEPAWHSVPPDATIAEGAEIRLDLRPYVTGSDDPEAPADLLVFALVDGYAPAWANIENRYELVLRPGHDIASKADPALSFELRLRVALAGGAAATTNAAFQVTVADVDRAPVVDGVELLPEIARTTDTLHAHVNAADPDDDALTLAYRWHKNGVLQEALTAATLPPEHTRKGDAWTVAAQAEAHGLLSGWAESAPRTIQNTPPAVPENIDVGRVVDRQAIEVDLANYATDADADDALVFSLTALPAHGTAELTGSVLRYTADWASLAGGEIGGDSLQFSASDGNATTTGTVDVSVEGVNDPPIIDVVRPLRLAAHQTSGQITWQADGDGMIHVADVDSPAAAWRLIPTALPESGILSDLSGAEVALGEPLGMDRFPLAYVPHAGAVNVDAVRFLANDGEIDSENGDVVYILFSRIEMHLAFDQGWNLFSLPMLPEPTAAADLLRLPARTEPIHMGKVWTWDTATRTYRTAEHLEPGRAYWIFCPSAPPEALVFSGAARGDSLIFIEPGWNLIGPVGHGTSGTVAQAGADSALAPTRLWTWNAGAYHMPAAHTLRRGHGYWLFTGDAETIDTELK